MTQFFQQVAGVVLDVVAVQGERFAVELVAGGVVATVVPGDAEGFGQFVRVEAGEDGTDAVYALFVADEEGAAAAFAAGGEERDVVAGEVGVIARDIGTDGAGEDVFVARAEGVDLVEVAGEVVRGQHRPVFQRRAEVLPVVGAARQGFFVKAEQHPPLPLFEGVTVGEILATVALV